MTPTTQPGGETAPEEPADLHSRYPDLVCWWGEHTQRWWALAPVGRAGRLMEGDSKDEVIRAVRDVLNEAAARSRIA
ncbi:MULTISPECIES: hypothetical protein [Actinomadura]|uniref:Uncharacterized protein n=1 Tax=Actinomadura miaoliensis TaxID=430685 RepID=A0ABP7UVZ1_9ACTN